MKNLRKRKLLPGAFLDFLLEREYVIPACPILRFKTRSKREVVKFRDQIYIVQNNINLPTEVCKLDEQLVVLEGDYTVKRIKPLTLYKTTIFGSEILHPQGRAVPSWFFFPIETEEKLLEKFELFIKYTPGAVSFPFRFARYLLGQGEVSVLPDKPLFSVSRAIEAILQLIYECRISHIYRQVVWDVLKEIEEKKAGKPWWEKLLEKMYFHLV